MHLLLSSTHTLQEGLERHESLVVIIDSVPHCQNSFDQCICSFVFKCAIQKMSIKGEKFQ